MTNPIDHRYDYTFLSPAFCERCDRNNDHEVYNFTVSSWEKITNEYLLEIIQLSGEAVDQEKMEEIIQKLSNAQQSKL